MKNIKIRSHVGADGILHLDIPVEMANTEIEVTLTIHSCNTTKRLGAWNIEEVIGGWVGEPLSRPEQGEYEIREQLF